MSRIGKQPITVPKSVQVTVNDRIIKAKGPKGELQVDVPVGINTEFENNVITFTRDNEEKITRSLHGLTRALAANVIEGVEKGVSKTLKIEGVGFKAEMKAKRLLLNLGYSHPILFIPPPGIEFVVTSPTTIIVNGNDKQLVGEVAAKVRRLRKPEPYKGKGIRYEGEYVRRKAGKTAAK
ncbi:MAG: 50S ribosomal protein L6 [Chlorobi bacterium]|nr:50S ribosomal protein L6 [Chlorobiota bacterium]